MAVSREEMQAELEGIIAEAEEQAEFTKAAEERGRFLNDPVNEFGHGYTVGISEMVGAPVDVVNAMLNAAGVRVDAPAGSGANIQDVLAELQGMPEDLPMEPTGVLGGAAEALGVATVITPLTLAPFMEMAMDPNFEQKMNVQIGQFRGTGKGTAGEIPRSKAARVAFLLKMAGQRIAKTAVEHPKKFIASEVAASAAAGAAMEFAEEKGAGPGAQMGIGLAAATIGGLSPSAIPRMSRNAWRWGMKNFNPFRKAGAEPRAAEQMQLRAEDATAAARSVEEMIDPATGALRPEFEGLTPARVTGEERLMAQEARVLADDPELDKLVREDLEAAIKRAEGELSSVYSKPRGKESWELAVFQRVAPDGVEITPGTSEEMLDQLYSVFKPMYAEFKGYPVRIGLMGTPGRTTTLETMMGNVQNTNRVLADDATRAKVGRWLDSQYEGLHRSIKKVDGVETFKSEDLLKVRSSIRTEARKAAKRNDLETVDLLKIAEEKINVLMKDQLPENVMGDLAIVDSHYRNYKIAEDAVYRGAAGDKGLTPDSLLGSLRASASSKGGYARGEQLELRSLAASGRPIAGVMKDPERVRRAVASMSEEDLLYAQQDFFDAILTKATVTDPDTGLEVLSGRNVKKQLEAFNETATALRMDESSMTRANEIADRLMIAQRPSPSPVGELYEDAPADILQLLATLIGAKHGQKVAGRGMGSGLVLAGWFAKKARTMLANLTTNQARIILANAQTDPELYKRLLTSVTDETVFQTESTQYLKAYLAAISQRGAREFTETPEDKAYEDELNRLRQEVQ